MRGNRELGSAPPRPRTDHRGDPRRPSRRAPRRRPVPGRRARRARRRPRPEPGPCRDGAGRGSPRRPVRRPARRPRRARPRRPPPRGGHGRRRRRRGQPRRTAPPRGPPGARRGHDARRGPVRPRGRAPHGLVAKGAEAGGRVGEETAFVLLQRLVAAVDGADLAAGGHRPRHRGRRHRRRRARRGPRRPARARPRLVRCRRDVRAAIAGMDGSETVVVGGHRLFARPDLDLPRPDTAPAEVAARLGADDLRAQLLPVGQDGSFARPLADRYKTAGGIVQAVRASIADHVAVARELRPLAPGAGTAASRGTAHPIAQGPMTRVSDRSGFAAAVAERRGAAVPRPVADAGRRDPRPPRRDRRRGRRPAVGRRHPRLRPARAPRGAAGGGARDAPAGRAHRRRPPVAGRAARGRGHHHVPARPLARPARPVLEGRRPPVRVRGPRVRRPRRPALELRPLGAPDRPAAPARATWPASRCSSPAASTTPARPPWWPRWPRRSPTGARPSAC